MKNSACKVYLMTKKCSSYLPFVTENIFTVCNFPDINVFCIEIYTFNSQLDPTLIPDGTSLSTFVENDANINIPRVYILIISIIKDTFSQLKEFNANFHPFFFCFCFCSSPVSLHLLNIMYIIRSIQQNIGGKHLKKKTDFLCYSIHCCRVHTHPYR